MEISKKNIMWVVMILSLISLGHVKVKAATPAPVAAAPGPDCMTALYNMTDCLGFVTKGSNDTKPDKSCCPELAGMLDSNPICLCQLFAKSKDYGIDIDMKRALNLPSFCKLQTPDISLCSAVGIPVGAPGVLAGAPTSSAPMSSKTHSSLSPKTLSPVATPMTTPVATPAATPEVAAAPGPGGVGSDCMTSLFNMSDCLGFVSKGSNATKPDKNCCPELAGMLDSNPICLCQLFAKSKDYGIDIDMKRALKLPSFCKLQTPDISLCSAVGIPVGAPGALVGAPAGAPTSGAPMSSETALSPSGMSPMAGEAGRGKNGGSRNAQFNIVTCLVAGLAMAFTLFKY